MLAEPDYRGHRIQVDAPLSVGSFPDGSLISGSSIVDACYPPARPLMDSSLPNLSGFTILVIEDDLDSLETLTTALTACGARVLSAPDTTLARRHFETTTVDLVVTDLRLPGESGAAFLTWLRMRPQDKGRGTAAVAITGYPQEFPATRVGGFAAYFQKPIDLLNVCSTIGAILRPPSRPDIR